MQLPVPPTATAAGTQVLLINTTLLRAAVEPAPVPTSAGYKRCREMTDGVVLATLRLDHARNSAKGVNVSIAGDALNWVVDAPAAQGSGASSNDNNNGQGNGGNGSGKVKKNKTVIVYFLVQGACTRSGYTRATATKGRLKLELVQQQQQDGPGR